VVTKERPEIGRDFYNQVQDTYIEEKLKSSLVFILGDFNSKIKIADRFGLYGSIREESQQEKRYWAQR
jgi:hypothetical protein